MLRPPSSHLTAQALLASPLGGVLLARTAAGLAGAWFTEGQKDADEALPLPGVPIAGDDPVLRQTALQFDGYWAGRRQAFDVPLDLGAGTPFQQAVWRALLEIPFGGTRSYGDIARHIGQPKAFQAVGMAVGANPLIIIVPCHRVIGRDTRLTGFSSGLPRKIDLLRREGWRIEGDKVSRPDLTGQADLFTAV